MDPSEEARDLRLFLREQTLRNDRLWVALRAEIRAGQAELEALVRQARRHAATTDLVLAEERAHTGALFHILDRLPEPGA